MPPCEVIGLGYCSWDYLGILDHIPDFDAPTESMSDFAISGGGPVATALSALAHLGVRTGYIGALGGDEPGRSALAAFQQKGIDTQRLRVQPGARSAVCFSLVQTKTAKRVILCYRGTTTPLQLDKGDREYIAAARFLHLDGHHMAAAIEAARIVHEAGGTVVLDANRPRPGLEDLLPWVHVLITNSLFPTAYSGESDLETAMGRLLKGGTRLVVTTLGARGCLYRSRDESVRVPGFRVNALDTTGAGDAFHGAFIYGLLRGWPPHRTATFANAVAALNCLALGGRPGLPTLGETEAFLRSEGRAED